MKRVLLCLLLLLAFQEANSQNIRTFNTLNFSVSHSSISNHFGFSYGEMIQIRKVIPFRFFTTLNYSGMIIKEGLWPEYIKTGSKTLTIKNHLFNSKFSIPIGFEIYKKNFAVGIAQEIITFSGKKTLDSSNFDINSSIQVKNVGSSFVFSPESRNNTATTLYGVFTLSDSFSLLGGIKRDPIIFNYFRNQIKVDFAGISKMSAFVSIRLNIEK